MQGTLASQAARTSSLTIPTTGHPGDAVSVSPRRVPTFHMLLPPGLLCSALFFGT